MYRWSITRRCCRKQPEEPVPFTGFATTTLFNLDGDVLFQLDANAEIQHVHIRGNGILSTGSVFSGPNVHRYSSSGIEQLAWRRPSPNRSLERKGFLFSNDNIAISGSGLFEATAPSLVLNPDGEELWQPSDSNDVLYIDGSDRLYAYDTFVFDPDYQGVMRIFDAEGNTITSLGLDQGITGSGLLTLGRVGVDENNGNIYVPSRWGLFAFDSDYNPLWAVPQDNNVRWEDVYVRSDGDLIVSVWTPNSRTTITRVSSVDGSTVWSRSIFHTCLCIDRDDNVWVGLSPTQTHERQELAATGGWSGGTFTLTFKGETTAPIRWDANSVDVAGALNNLPAVQATGFKVLAFSSPAARLPTSTVRVVFQWFEDVPLLTADLSGITASGTPGLNVTQEVAGAGSETLRKYNTECDEILLRLKRPGGTIDTGEQNGTVVSVASYGERVVAGGSRVAIPG